MKISQALDLIEQIAPPNMQAEWDNSGVQIAGRKEEVYRLAVMLDPLSETVDPALDWNADLIFSHHPLALTPKLPSRLDGFHHILRRVLGADAWLYSAHTSLDTNPDGPVNWLANDLLLEQRGVIEPVGSAQDNAGYGIVGTLPSAQPLEVFLDSLGRHINRPFWTVCGPRPDNIRRVGICPGSGSSMAEDAFAMGADVFITGDMKYHQAQETTGCIVDVGHFCLEEEMMRRLAASLAHKLETSQVDVRFFAGKDPFEIRLAHKS